MDAKYWLRKQWHWFLEIIYMKWNNYHFNQKKKEADRLHKLTGKRYYVLPISKSRLGVVNNEYLKVYNKWAAHNNRKKIRLPDLLDMAYYHTPQEPLTRKKSSPWYTSWQETVWSLICFLRVVPWQPFSYYDIIWKAYLPWRSSTRILFRFLLT